MSKAKAIAKSRRVSVSELLKPGQKYLTRCELARVLNVSVRKVDSMIAAREIPVLHLGKMVRFRLEDVERHLSETMLTDIDPEVSDQWPEVRKENTHG